MVPTYIRCSTEECSFTSPSLSPVSKISSLSHLKNKKSLQAPLNLPHFPSPSLPTFLEDCLHILAIWRHSNMASPLRLTDGSRSPATSTQPDPKGRFQFSPHKDLLPASVHSPPSWKTLLHLGFLLHTHLLSSTSQATPPSTLLPLSLTAGILQGSVLGPLLPSCSTLHANDFVHDFDDHV